ncbi:MAG TPA: carboxypeptidase-like regulatory domain-containing protein, partial [Thermoanaerobaculia bacterium]|nr:carboxypeptidase-like regulatory domain-containing protein [Thermoanaerobaculia bacterium]
MRRTAISIAGPLALLLGGTSLRALPPPVAPPISGVVSHMEKPIAGALVVFYNVADLTLTRSRTATDGTFVVASAPVGVYDLVAYKRGFVPALVRIWHQNLPDSVSAVHIQLSARKPDAENDPASPDASLWDLRDRLPDDVLREITMEEGAGPAAVAALPKDLRIDKGIAGEVRTVANVASNDASLNRAAVGVHGGLPNGWQYNLRGDYAAVSDSTTPSPDVSTTGNAAG